MKKIILFSSIILFFLLLLLFLYKGKKNTKDEAIIAPKIDNSISIGGSKLNSGSNEEIKKQLELINNNSKEQNTTVINVDDIPLIKEEKKVKDIKELNKKINEMYKNLVNEFSNKSKQTQETYLKLFLKNLGVSYGITTDNFILKIKNIFIFLNNQKEYSILEKISEKKIEDILNGDFLNIIKTKRKLYNEMIISI